MIQVVSEERLRSLGARPVARAFSLVEVMIVIVIVALLAGVATFAAIDRLGEAEVSRAELDLQTLEGGLKDFRRRMGRYPTDEEGLAVLWSSSTLENPDEEEKWSKTLEDPLPNDPFGGEWGYRAESENGNDDTFDLWSNGRDGEEGTEDDITNWSGPGGGGSDGDFDFDFDSGGGG
ncbi:MAG: type II secretion system major pseudopilin GspG [Planctomycetota bacterium]